MLQTLKSLINHFVPSSYQKYLKIIKSKIIEISSGSEVSQLIDNPDSGSLFITMFLTVVVISDVRITGQAHPPTFKVKFLDTQKVIPFSEVLILDEPA